MGNNYGTKYDVDIVMCIDATGSMAHVINMVKENALSFYSDFLKRLSEFDPPKRVNDVRVRVVAFRDYLADGERAMLLSNFFKLPEQAAEFEALVRGIKAEGGGDDPEDGLEALAYAIRSKWNTEEGNKKRHVIVLWTDAGAHELGFGRNPENGKYLVGRMMSAEQLNENAKKYPVKMAKDFNELSEWWGVGQSPNSVLNPSFKRLLIYAPNEKTWTTIAKTWDNAILFPSTAGSGLKSTTYSEILDALCGSV